MSSEKLNKEFIIACRYGCVEIVKLLIEQKLVNLNNLECNDVNKALFDNFENPDMLELIISNGFDINNSDGKIMELFLYDISWKTFEFDNTTNNIYVETLNILLDYGANFYPNHKKYTHNIFRLDNLKLIDRLMNETNLLDNLDIDLSIKVWLSGNKDINIFKPYMDRIVDWKSILLSLTKCSLDFAIPYMNKVDDHQDYLNTLLNNYNIDYSIYDYLISNFNVSINDDHIVKAFRFRNNNAFRYLINKIGLNESTAIECLKYSGQSSFNEFIYIHYPHLKTL